MAFPELFPMPKAIRLGHQVRPFMGGKPTGVTLHYAADRNIENVIQALHEKNLNYHLIIDRDGSVVQTAFLNMVVNHAGKAIWRGQSPNSEHVSVCLMSWGQVHKLGDEFVSWANVTVPCDDVAERSGNILLSKGQWWDMATPAQENKLLEVLRWFCQLGIHPADICGHDECAVPSGRKNDPGGVLSMTMPQLRKHLSPSV